MPALYRVYTSTTTFEDTIKIFTWIEKVAKKTLENLMVEPPLEPPSTDFAQDDWMKVCNVFILRIPTNNH